ncbi:MAG: radical SAM/SPASM domain-containing protein [Candidatus Sumerlaeaceae bacterium]|jgi:MoaA/NifB/PqqE/SkfB family radical SAM enzyme
MRELTCRALALLAQEPAWLARHPKLAQAAYRAFYRLAEEASDPGNEGAPPQSRKGNHDNFGEFQHSLRRALEECSDPLAAHALNAALQEVEFHRGLGRVASLPTHGVLYLSQLADQGELSNALASVLLWAREFTIVADVWPAPSAACLASLGAHFVQAPCAARLLVRHPALLEAGELKTFFESVLCQTLIVDFGNGEVLPPPHEALPKVTRFLWEWNHENPGQMIHFGWQLRLNRKNLSWLATDSLLDAQFRPHSIALFLERARDAAAIPRSLFFCQEEAQETLSRFVARCKNMNIELIGAPALLGMDSHEPAFYRRAYGSAHLAGNMASSCFTQQTLRRGHVRHEWDDADWISLREQAARGCFSRDCYECQAPANRNVWEVPYLLAAYEESAHNEPPMEYLDVVRQTLDAVAKDSVARRLNAEIRNYEHRHGLRRVASYPHRMYIEVTDECNLRCPMCTQTVLSGPRKRISLDVFAKIRPLLRYMDLIHFTGCGETFLHPQLMEMLAEVPHEHCAVRIITNGLLLGEAISRRLIELGLHELWISIDGVDAKTFEKIRGSKLFHRVIDNVRTLTRLRRELKRTRPRVALNFVAQRSNIEQLPDFVRMAKDLGADAVNVGFLQVYSRELLTESLYFYQELSDRCMADAKRVAEELGLALYLPGFFGQQRTSQTDEHTAEGKNSPDAPRLKCVEPYGFVLVHADGSLGPCCVNDSRLGSLRGMDFVEAWVGPAYEDFRRRVSTPEEDFDCQHCMLEGYKDIHEFEHHAKLFDETYQRADVDYAALEREIRDELARRQSA